jgi:hypothetical protein
VNKAAQPTKGETTMTTKQIDDIKRLLADLEAAEKHKQVLRDELTRLRDVVSAVEYDAIDAALADTEVQP